MIFSKIRKKFGWYNLRKESAKWIEKNLGSYHVNEFLEKYDNINKGISIGNLEKTIIFLDMVNRIKQEI